MLTLGKQQEKIREKKDEKIADDDQIAWIVKTEEKDVGLITSGGYFGGQKRSKSRQADTKKRNSPVGCGDFRCLPFILLVRLVPLSLWAFICFRRQFSNGPLARKTWAGRVVDRRSIELVSHSCALGVVLKLCTSAFLVFVRRPRGCGPIVSIWGTLGNSGRACQVIVSTIRCALTMILVIVRA